MARPPPIEFPRALYPVTSRDNGRAAIYLNDSHGEMFVNLDILDAITGYPYDKGMDFEWHVAKAEENVRKHGVDFPTATRVFLDPHRIEREDTRTSYRETRLEVIGMVGEQVLVVIYTPRADRIRIISARKANRRERRAYDTGETAS
jgi:uncharacterized DUF497 family protein